jgi:hypothetical protein
MVGVDPPQMKEAGQIKEADGGARWRRLAERG